MAIFLWLREILDDVSKLNYPVNILSGGKINYSHWDQLCQDIKGQLQTNAIMEWSLPTSCQHQSQMQRKRASCWISSSFSTSHVASMLVSLLFVSTCFAELHDSSCKVCCPEQWHCWVGGQQTALQMHLWCAKWAEVVEFKKNNSCTLVVDSCYYDI